MYSIYIVQPGDTLSQIALKFNITTETIMESNPHIEDQNLIFPGMSINILTPDQEESTDTSQYPEWYNIALRELESGVSEIPGKKNNPRILEYHSHTLLHATDDETPWCSSFVNWCIEKSGLSGTRSAAARSWLKWGKQLEEPQVGCIVVFKRGNSWQGHVGFYHNETNNHILVLGGNQSNSVSIKSYPKPDLLAYRWSK